MEENEQSKGSVPLRSVEKIENSNCSLFALSIGSSIRINTNVRNLILI